MTLTPQQEKLFVDPAPVPPTVFVNARVSFQTEDNQRVLLVHGIVFSHYSLDDRSAEAYALVLLFESGYADQNDLARCFGYSTRPLRRFQGRRKAGGPSTLARLQGGRPSGSSAEYNSMAARDRSILRLKAKGMSNRWIGGRLGLDEKMIRKTLRRLGWKPAPQPTLPLLPKIAAHAQPVLLEDRSLNQIPTSAASPSPPQSEKAQSRHPAFNSLDPNPLDRSADRLLAALGLLDDAAPLFAPACHLPRAGVLLAIPALVGSGLLAAAEKIYGSIGPSFYGLRTTLVAYILLALLRIARPEALKEYAPGELGRIVGLDRMPEVTTVRRKLTRLAASKASHELDREIARHRIQEHDHVFGFL